ncbi:MAG: hypothetical protein MUO26_04145 [Methanotrichaceae archaeon]|nr:hypothetical protein [Methanotrichaceae archaeon]
MTYLHSLNLALTVSATVLLYSPGIEPFLEDLAELADRVFYFEESLRDPPRVNSQNLEKMKDQEMLEVYRS